MHPWRERLHRWFAPAARRCPLSPNAITLLALLLNAIAAALLYRQMFLVAIVFVTIGGLADAFDGIVARVQEKASRYGDFLDHFADRVSDTLLITGWLLGNRVRLELVVAAIIVVMLNGYIGTQIEATWRERSYEGVGRGEFVLGLIVYPIASHLLVANGLDTTRHAGLFVAEWMTVALIALAVFGMAQRFRLASRLERSQS
jgi:phosphatidylglycerophosphate synthase